MPWSNDEHLIRARYAMLLAAINDVDNAIAIIKTMAVSPSKAFQSGGANADGR